MTISTKSSSPFDDSQVLNDVEPSVGRIDTTSDQGKAILLYCNWGVVQQSDGSLAIPSVHKRYLLALVNLGYTRVTLMTKTTCRRLDGFDALLDIPELEVVSLPWFDRYGGAAQVFWSVFATFRRVSRFRYNKVYIRVFEPFTWALVLLFALRDRAFTRKNVIMHFIADPKSAIFGNSRHSLLKKWVRLLVFMPEYCLTLMATCLCRPTANGPIPIAEIPTFFSRRFVEVIESALTEDDVVFALGDGGEPTQRETPYVLLYVGYLRYAKGINVLLEGVRRVATKGETNFVLKIVGEGEYRSQAEEFIAENGLENQIELLGYIPFSKRLFEVYRTADIFINPSLSETGPRVLLEAKVFGNYLISTDVGYANTIIENDGQGLIVPRGDADAISMAVRKALEAVRRGVVARPRSLADFNHNVTAEQFLRQVLDET